jgi:hypothetical protein
MEIHAPNSDHRPSLFSTYGTRFLLRSTAAFIAPPSRCFFGSPRSVAAFGNLKNRLVWYGRIRAIERRRADYAGWPRFPANRSVNSGTSGRADDDGAEHRSGRGRTVAIGFYTSLLAGNLRASLIDVRQRFPQIEIEMLETPRSRLATALRNGAVDIVIVPGCPSSDDLRHIAGFRKGGSGLSVNKIMRHAVDAASGGLRLSGA